MKKYILLSTFILMLILGCKNDLILVVDSYNPPYNIVAVPKNNGITLKFWSGVLSTDFAGFNIYVNNTGSFTQIDDAIINSSSGGLPTITSSDHSRSLFNIDVPGTYNNGTLYYVAITSYGTNSLATNGYLETKISTVSKVVPRPEGTSTLANNSVLNILGPGNIANIDDGTTPDSLNMRFITPIPPYRIQSLGIQSNFTDVVIVSNMNYTLDFDELQTDIQINKMFILFDNTSLVKLYITATNDTGTTLRWSYQANAAIFNGL